MLAPGGEFESDSPLLRMSLRSLAIYPDFVGELRRETGFEIDYQSCGGLEVALSDSEALRFRQLAERRAALGIPSESRTHRHRPAWFYPGDATVDPRHLTRALMAACRARGVAIHENEAVLAIEPDGGAVRTERGRYADSGVVIAAGAWSSGLFPGLRPTRPVRGHLVSYLLPGVVVPTILRNNGTYILQRSSGLIIAGSSTEDAGFDRAIDERVVADIEARVAELLPDIGRPAERWNGLRPGIEGEGPAIGRVPATNVITAFGHYRNGILLAPETGRLVAELAA